MKAFADRFKEPSSWAGLGILISMGAKAFGLPEGAAESIIAVGVSVAGLLAILLPEKK